MEQANGGSGGKKRCDQHGAVPGDHWRGLCLDKRWRWYDGSKLRCRPKQRVSEPGKSRGPGKTDGRAQEKCVRET